MTARASERTIAAVAAVALLAGCVTAGESVRNELYFGFNRAGHPVVSEEAWRDFVAAEVTPRFPSGFTVVPAHGQWQNDGGAIDSEESRVLIVFAPASPEVSVAIEAIRKAYVARFGMESVLRVTSP